MTKTRSLTEGVKGALRTSVIIAGQQHMLHSGVS